MTVNTCQRRPKIERLEPIPPITAQSSVAVVRLSRGVRGALMASSAASSTTRSGASSCGQWPMPGRTSSRLCGMAVWSRGRRAGRGCRGPGRPGSRSWTGRPTGPLRTAGLRRGSADTPRTLRPPRSMRAAAPGRAPGPATSPTRRTKTSSSASPFRSETSRSTPSPEGAHV